MFTNKDYPAISLNNEKHTFIDNTIKMSDQNTFNENTPIWRENPMFGNQDKLGLNLANKVEEKLTQGYSVNFKLNNQCKNCVLILKQTFHPNWKVTVNGKNYKAFPVFPFFTGIQIRDAGDYQVTIIYRPSNLKTILLVFSTFFFIFVFKKFLREV